MQREKENSEEVIEDSFDHFQPKKTRFADEVEFKVSNIHKKGAKNLAKRLLKLSKIGVIPVDLLKIQEFLNDADLYILDILPNPDFTSRISAQIVKTKLLNEEIYTLGYNPAKPYCHQRFSIAHELGHLIFNTTHILGSGKSDIEIDANIFAADLLMPTDILKTDLKTIKNVKELAIRYRVSEEAMFRKINDNNLLKYI